MKNIPLSSLSSSSIFLSQKSSGSSSPRLSSAMSISFRFKTFSTACQVLCESMCSSHSGTTKPSCCRTNFSCTMLHCRAIWSPRSRREAINPQTLQRLLNSVQIQGRIRKAELILHFDANPTKSTEI